MSHDPIRVACETLHEHIRLHEHTFVERVVFYGYTALDAGLAVQTHVARSADAVPHEALRRTAPRRER